MSAFPPSDQHRRRRHTGPALLVVGILLGLFALGAQPFAVRLMPSPWDQLAHVAIFAVLAFALGLLSDQRGGHMWLVAVAGSLLIGALDEWHQTYLPGRNAGWNDLAMDAVGSLAGATVLVLVRRRFARPGEALPPKP